MTRLRALRGPGELEVSRAAVSARWFQIFIVAAGLSSAILFIALQLYYRLELFGDGSIFSYSVAVEDAWVFHWHNIPARLLVYVVCYLPAEAYVHLARDPQGGIALYGLIFSGAQLAALLGTWAVDRSAHRIFFSYACASTACICPFVFGFPTEMWMAHAAFWPALALCHCAARTLGGAALILVSLLALAFTHEGALVLAAAILFTLSLRGLRDPALVRAGAMFSVVLLIWAAVKIALPPDDYIIGVMHRAAWDFIDVRHLWESDMFRLIAGGLISYAIIVRLLWSFAPTGAAAYAAALVAAALMIYWAFFDHTLHAENRYYLRTVLLIAIPLLGGLAASYVLAAEGRLAPVPFLPRLAAVFASPAAFRVIAGAIALMLLVHGVETAKFVTAWTQYIAAVRALATGMASDPMLGDARFVSSERIGPDLNRLSWSSTIPYLSVLVAPGLLPARLVMDPEAGYFWLSCATAMQSEEADLAIPAQSRHLIRVHACLHR